MTHQFKSIRPFIGAKNFSLSRQFYRELGFEERIHAPNLSVFLTGQIAFYLQDYYVKDWIDNTMLFMEVGNVDQYWQELHSLNLTSRYENVRIEPVRKYEWGCECFLHDPSGVLWHFGQFFRR